MIQISHYAGQLDNGVALALSKAVLHALGCVATKIGLVDIASEIGDVTWVIDSEQSIFQVEPGVHPKGIYRISGQLKSPQVYPADK
jgi:hypothetical protein